MLKKEKVSLLEEADSEGSGDEDYEPLELLENTQRSEAGMTSGKTWDLP